MLTRFFLMLSKMVQNAQNVDHIVLILLLSQHGMGVKFVTRVVVIV